MPEPPSQRCPEPPPDSLPYALPDLAQNDPRRTSAAAHALGSGRGSTVIGVALMFPAVLGLLSDHRREALLAGAYASLFFTSGILYTFAAHHLYRPNHTWETLLRITTLIHMLALLPIFALLAWSALHLPPEPLRVWIPLAIVTLMLVSLAISLHKARQLRRFF